MVQQIFREHGGIDVFSVFDRGWFDKYISESCYGKLAEQYRDKEIIWNVKNDIPIGRAICGTFISVPAREFMVLSVNIRYLNTKMQVIADFVKIYR